MQLIKIISQKKINLVIKIIIYLLMFYILFRIGYSILGLNFSYQEFSVGSQRRYDPVKECNSTCQYICGHFMEHTDKIRRNDCTELCHSICEGDDGPFNPSDHHTVTYGV